MLQGRSGRVHRVRVELHSGRHGQAVALAGAAQERLHGTVPSASGARVAAALSAGGPHRRLVRSTRRPFASQLEEELGVSFFKKTLGNWCRLDDSRSQVRRSLPAHLYGRARSAAHPRPPTRRPLRPPRRR